MDVSWTLRKAEHWRIDAFELWCWRRLLRVPWTAGRSNQSIRKEISPEYSLEGLMLRFKLQYTGHLIRTTDSLEKTLLGKIDGRRRRGSDGWMASPTQWIWELDYKGDWTSKNWCFQIVMLEKTLESPLDSKEIKPVNPKGNQPWIFIGRSNAEAEAPILWPPDAKRQLVGNYPDFGKNWGLEKKGTTDDEMDWWHHWLNRHAFEQTPGESEGRVGQDLATKQQQSMCIWCHI